MKLKPQREKIAFKEMLKILKSTSDSTSNTAITLDVDGGICFENFKKILECRENKIVIETKRKTVYIYGQNLTLNSCSIHSATACGEIEKIEIFAKEV